MDRLIRNPRAALPWAIAALAVIFALGAYFRFVSAAPLGIDTAWNDLVGATRGSLPYAIAIFLAQIGASIGAAASTAIVAALLLVKRRARDAGAVVTALLLGVGTSELIKSLVLRPRPEGPLFETWGSSFPSGHSMGAAALSGSIALAVTSFDGISRQAIRWTWIGAAVWTLTMMWSRTALHAHWLSDTLAGAALGIAAAFTARALWIRTPPQRVTLEP
ncbi:phosphatase PAP2 family protein [Leucobacter sp. CSA2]|uniref:Phosphatase PAP2 family protein n=1 Tax=Leucobacter edaphi TaxID=2796472 RepID=A0A934QA93_9MICO|nr:phosphatase PAP2 family protein [Leucobacter edaphi]MBK0420653.1 phosphatase PAP2 family protein [Leucobacter edaphi]